VYSNGVLHHAQDTDRTIAEVRRVLKPGGKAIIMLYARHSAIFWLNIVPRAIVTGEIFRWPEAQWIGRLTEGTPKFGTVRNPITRVYSKRELRELFGGFRIESLRRNSFQFDNFAIPRLTQVRRRILSALGHKPHPGGIFVYGAPYFVETSLERFLGHWLGFGWNIVAVKQ
jgi:SAM-dependent methyltransferase